MSKDQLIGILDSAWDNGVPFIDYTDYYVYCLIPQGGDKWKEVSYDIKDQTLDERDINPTIAFRMLVEEMEKGISAEITDFMLNDFKAFRTSLDEKSPEEKIIAIIKEMTENRDNYSKSLPIITSKENLGDVKAKL